MASRRLPTRAFTPGFGAGMRKAPVANARVGSLIREKGVRVIFSFTVTGFPAGGKK